MMYLNEFDVNIFGKRLRPKIKKLIDFAKIKYGTRKFHIIINYYKYK